METQTQADKTTELLEGAKVLVEFTCKQCDKPTYKYAGGFVVQGKKGPKLDILPFGEGSDLICYSCMQAYLDKAKARTA